MNFQCLRQLHTSSILVNLCILNYTLTEGYSAAYTKNSIFFFRNFSFEICKFQGLCVHNFTCESRLQRLQSTILHPIRYIYKNLFVFLLLACNLRTIPKYSAKFMQYIFLKLDHLLGLVAQLSIEEPTRDFRRYVGPLGSLLVFLKITLFWWSESQQGTASLYNI